MKYNKKIVNVFLLLMLILGIEGKKINAESISTPIYYTLGTQENGFITENGDSRQYYMFTLPSSGSIEIKGSAHMEWIELYIYDKDANEVWNTVQKWNSTSEVISINHTLYLTSGVYYFCISKKYACNGEFNFNIDFNSSNESFTEISGGSNNTLASANYINTDGTSYNAQISLNDDKDFFEFVLHESGKVNFNALFYEMEWVQWRVYNEEGTELLFTEHKWNGTTKNITVNEDLYLTSGTYYISISKRYDCNGRYTFSLPFLSSKETCAEINGGSNNTISSASSLILENDYIGQMALNDDKDFYMFTLDKDQSVSINVQAEMEYVYVRLYDFTGNELSSYEPYWNNTTKKINFQKTIILEKGIYYITIASRYSCYGNYILNVSPLTKSNCPHEEYNSQWYNSTYFTNGYREYVCKECGYSYKTDYEPIKKLNQGYLYSYCNAGKKNLNLYWATITEASGYQIRYSTKKDLKKGAMVRTINGQSSDRISINKLKRNKKYYVQVRAYKTEYSKKVYGKWSKKIVLKTTK